MQPEDIVLAAFGALSLGAGASLAILVRRGRSSHGGRRWTRLLAGNLLSLLCLCSLILFGGELYYRFVYDTTDSLSLTKVSRRWFQRHSVINGAGMRDTLPGYPFQPPPGKRRVTFIGDSFTEGHGVADVQKRFVNLVRARHPEWEVHMFAKLGADTGSELASLQQLIDMTYRFDVVVLVYCLNDISDIVPECKAILARIHAGGEPNYLVEHSYFVNLLYWRWRAARDPYVRDYDSFVVGAYEGPLWEEQKRRLAEFESTVRSSHGRLLVVTFPFLDKLAADSPYRGVQDRLSSFWRQLGTPNLDLRELYVSHASEELVVNSHDAHPNERAHDLAADAIEAFLLAELSRSQQD
jgi:hypothetical protein